MIRADISGDRTGFDLIPAVQSFQDFSCRITGQLSDYIFVLGINLWLTSNIQVVVYPGNQKIVILI